MASKIVYIDCSAGISGLALLGALLDAATGVVDFSLETIQTLPSVLSLPHYQVRSEVVWMQGGRGLRLVMLPPEGDEGPARYLYTDLVSALQSSTLVEPVRERSLAIMRSLVEAQTAISGDELASITYSPQLLIEIVGVVLGLHAFGVQHLYATPLPLTGGLVEKNGEVYPVPSPLVVEILRQMQAPWKASPLDGEIVTAEGAAILTAYAHFTIPALIVTQVGYGFVTPRAALRLCVGTEQAAVNHTSSLSVDAAPADVDYVTVIETHIDNMTGELLGGLVERLFAVGALDVTYTPIQMKKNRPASLLTVISSVELGEQLALLLLRETSTLGVRIQQVQRRKAQREQQRIETPLGAVLVKIKRLGTQIISVAPEYEECLRIAREQQRPLADVYEIVREAIKSAIV